MNVNTDMTLAEAMHRVKEQMTMVNLAENTRKGYLLEIRRFFDHYGKSPAELGAEDVRDWIMTRIQSGLTPGSTNMTAAALRFLYRDALRRPEVVNGLRNQRIPRKLPRHMTVQEVERLMLAVTDLRYRAAIVLTYAAGLRISETVAVQIGDIRSGKRLLHIRSGKGGVERMAPIPPKAIDYLRTYWKNIFPRPVTWLFCGKSTDEPIKTDVLRNAFNAARDRVGIDNCYSFHCLRHSCAAHMHERGGSIDVIQDALGHRQSDTTRGYARATSKMFEALKHPLSDFTMLGS